ncbi:MAG: hypothetical protein K2Q20_08975 [Phycisphaerales bacterium]|nr:hypothetical protein [Phycisphaerales bacterium]
MHVRHDPGDQRGFGRFAAALAVAAAAVVGGGLGSEAVAQNAYYENASGDLAVRLQQWNEGYWARADAAGTPAPGASAIRFTGLVSNADLFNPVRAARWTLEDLKVVSASDCDGMETWPAIGTGGIIGTDQEKVVQAFRDAMKQGKFSTNIGQNPEGTQEHAGLIVAAPPGEGVIAYQDGDKLVSLNLPLKTISEPAYAAALEFNLSTESQAVLATMIASSEGWAAASADRASEAESLLTGAPSKADRFAEIVGDFLWIADVQSATVDKLQAQFGLFGQLPLVHVNLSDCTVLLDPLSGNVSGPFKLGSATDARGLLGFYTDAYAAGSGVRYFATGGCLPLSQTAPAIGRPPRPGTAPAPNAPGTMPNGGPPPGGGWTTGAWSPWNCNARITGGQTLNCTCTRTRRHGRWESKPCWFGSSTCIRWTEVTETETCSDINPAGGCNPPGASAACNAKTPY